MTRHIKMALSSTSIMFLLAISACFLWDKGEETKGKNTVPKSTSKTQKEEKPDEPDKPDEIDSNIKEYILFVGNPGVGKSTLINSLLKKKVADSGISLTGTGVTKKMQSYVHDNITYIDTPGLNEDEAADKLAAAKEIEAALKFNGKYRIFFVMTLEAGRIRPADIATINEVMNSINAPDKKYNIIITKSEEKIIKEIQNNPNNSVIKSANLGENKTNSIYALPLQADADFINLEDSFRTWIYSDSNSMIIKPDDIKPMVFENEEKIAEYERQIKELKKNSGEK